MGDRGHRKGQLRVLGSPSARHTKEPRTGGPPGGRGVRGPDFFLRKSLRTYLRVLKPDCRPPGPIGTILATYTPRQPPSAPLRHMGGAMVARIGPFAVCWLFHVPRTTQCHTKHFGTPDSGPPRLYLIPANQIRWPPNPAYILPALPSARTAPQKTAAGCWCKTRWRVLRRCGFRRP